MLKDKLKIKAVLYLICAIIIFTPLITSADIPALDYTGDDYTGDEVINIFKDDLNVTGGKMGYVVGSPQDINKLRMTLTITIIRSLLGILGILFLILIIWGGYEWMFSGGNEERVTKAKQRIKMAVNGLIIVLLAYAISSFIFINLASAPRPN